MRMSRSEQITQEQQHAIRQSETALLGDRQAMKEAFELLKDGKRQTAEGVLRQRLRTIGLVK